MQPAARAPRIAFLGFSIECNRFAPVSRAADFTGRTWLTGAELLAEARAPSPAMLAETPGFVARMDETGPWQPVPLRLGMAEPGGPVEHGFFAAFLDEVSAGLGAALPLDAVYVCLHGAALTTGEDDPDGLLLARVREIVGPGVPVVATLDLHANVSERMVSTVDIFVGYRTNPHLDMRERGAEAADGIRALLAGMKTRRAFLRLPVVPPTVTMLTAAGPYAELIALGTERLRPPIVNVSVMGGFAYGDTAKNGLCVVVTESGDGSAAKALAAEIGAAAWARRGRFRARLSSLDETIARASEAAADPALPAVCIADVADNPGGGGGGNTPHLVRALLAAGIKGALVGILHDPPLAAEAHRLGEGARFTARFNRAPPDRFAEPFEADAVVRRLHDGRCVGRRGIFAGNAMAMGPTASLDLGGVTVVVVSQRRQCADPVFFEMLGLDVAAARVVAVKSRGHFRGGFDEFFAPDQIVEADLPGLTSPMLERFEWTRLPRPVVPLDDDFAWQGSPTLFG